MAFPPLAICELANELLTQVTHGCATPFDKRGGNGNSLMRNLSESHFKSPGQLTIN
ncbi:hypothetical protein THII_0258 [Thioploca ingrica]|uniref:Uncharacterized protein n=1 Tax=Thioploca ingrica TaxID=40754 RepID=A0A090AIC1_9GAMM|nr:hypothetical protein THII_0258 [Thioploca ingrica]